MFFRFFTIKTKSSQLAAFIGVGIGIGLHSYVYLLKCLRKTEVSLICFYNEDFRTSGMKSNTPNRNVTSSIAKTTTLTRT